MRHGITLCLLLFAAGAVLAQAPAPAKISLSLADADVTQALTTLSEKAQVSILGDSTVKGKVSCSLSEVTAEEALDTICKMNKLEWVRAYASPGTDEKLSAGKLFKLLDALKELGTSSLVCRNPNTGSDTIFVPGAESGTVDAAGVAAGLKLKAVYMVRAVPDPAAAQAERDRLRASRQAQQPAQTVVPPDVQAAATQMWNSFGQMPMDQRFQVMHEMRQMMYDSLTPEERQSLWQRFGGDRGRRGDGNRPPQAPQ